VIMDDGSTDGTYEYLMENAKKFNILSVLKNNTKEEMLNGVLVIESDFRQRLYDEAFKHSQMIICLDTDEYLDGQIDKNQLKEILKTNKDTLFYTQWMQYTGKNKIRVDGKWQLHWVDRIGSYQNRAVFKPRQNHSEHLPTPPNQKAFNLPVLFVAHLQWLDKKTVATKQYFWKVCDYINKKKFGVETIDSTEYDRSVNDFKWTEVEFQFPLKIRSDVYSLLEKKNDYKFAFIRENIKKFDIPNLNDWGLGIHNDSLH